MESVCEAVTKEILFRTPSRVLHQSGRAITFDGMVMFSIVPSIVKGDNSGVTDRLCVRVRVADSDGAIHEVKTITSPPLLYRSVPVMFSEQPPRVERKSLRPFATGLHIFEDRRDNYHFVVTSPDHLSSGYRLREKYFSGTMDFFVHENPRNASFFAMLSCSVSLAASVDHGRPPRVPDPMLPDQTPLWFCLKPAELLWHHRERLHECYDEVSWEPRPSFLPVIEFAATEGRGVPQASVRLQPR